MPIPLARALQAKTSTMLDAQGAANVWAGTTGKDLLGALNAKNGTVGLDFVGVVTALNTSQALNAETEPYR